MCTLYKAFFTLNISVFSQFSIKYLLESGFYSYDIKKFIPFFVHMVYECPPDETEWNLWTEWTKCSNSRSRITRYREDAGKLDPNQGGIHKLRGQ